MSSNTAPVRENDWPKALRCDGAYSRRGRLRRLVCAGKRSKTGVLDARLRKARYSLVALAASILVMVLASGCGRQTSPARTIAPAPSAPRSAAQQMQYQSHEGLRNAARLRGQMMQRAEQKH